VKRAAHVEGNRAPRPARQRELRSGVDAARRAADDELSGRVVIGDDDNLAGLALDLVYTRHSRRRSSMPINAHMVPSRIAAMARPRSMTRRMAAAGWKRRAAQATLRRTRPRLSPRPRRHRGRRAACSATCIRPKSSARLRNLVSDAGAPRPPSNAPPRGRGPDDFAASSISTAMGTCGQAHQRDQRTGALPESSSATRRQQDRWLS